MSLDELADKEPSSSEEVQLAPSDSKFRGLSPAPIPIPAPPSIRSLLDSVSDERVNVDIVASHQSENGSISTASSAVSLESEKAAYEFLAQTPVRSTDAHLVEFSEAMRTVAKALRRVAEGKAAAQAEAAEWKRKYELETAHKQQSKIKGYNSCISNDLDKLASQLTLETPAPDQLGCCGSLYIVLTPLKGFELFFRRWLREHKNTNIFVEPRVKKELLTGDSYYNFVQTWDDDEEIKMLHTKVDLIVTLGGDGTVLWAASLFKGPVPPVVAFALGSLGFMTPFPSEQYRELLDNVLNGPFSITLRNRIQCHVIRDAAKDEIVTEEPFLVLNEVTIDRGISSYLTNLEVYCDSSFVTCVQGDGLIISTTSGSTAYSLAAGGSMVHPQVPGILFTPICPHSLSFRPLILPEYVTLRVQVPYNSRGNAWASFDGKDRQQLSPGDALICSISPWPVPTACLVDSTTDFLRSIHEGLHWNLRKSQSFDGPRD
ncbi:unnamed protein product [Miscanthus lutarioriparius]|uniref:NAD(+) kinase n=1 Tax=Miscanthus lutarioriparius TaxID=422564 RepID=A0A811P7U1_9POAL|nr:unnamed protein product [Miscanthus lutarioriparius]